MKLVKQAALVAALSAYALVATPALAGPTLGTIPGTNNSNEFINNFLGKGVPIEGWYDANLKLSANSTVTVQYLGAEAGYVNRFTMGGHNLTHNGGFTFHNSGSSALNGADALSWFTLTDVGAGLLDFGFFTNSATASVTNGANIENVGYAPNFFVSFDNDYSFDVLADGVAATSGRSVVLFLDDGGGGNDDNHDDMVVRLTVSNGSISVVPVPGTLALVGIGMLGLGVANRRKRACSC